MRVLFSIFAMFSILAKPVALLTQKRHTPLGLLLLFNLFFSEASHAITVVYSAAFSPSTIKSGESSILSWTSNGIYCVVDGIQYIGPDGSRTYTKVTHSKTVDVSCTLPEQMGGDGATTQSATLTVSNASISAPTSVSVSSADVIAVESTSHCTNGICIPNYYGSVTLSWPAALGTVTHYEVQKQFNGGSWSSLYTGTSRSKTSSSMAVGTWRFRVRACHNTDCSDYRYSSDVSVTSPTPAIPDSMSISPTSTTATSVSASWSSVPGHITHYDAQRRLDSGSWSTFYSGADSSTTSSAMSVGSWRFRVRACNESDCSLYRDGNTVAINDALPGIPRSLDTGPSETTNHEVQLSWHTASGVVTRYEIERRKDGGSWSVFYSGMGDGSPTMPGIPEATSTAMTVGNWDFRIRACNNSGCGGDRTGHSVIVKHPIPGKPSSMSVSPGNTTNTHVTASWGSATGHVLRYEAQRRYIYDAGWEDLYSGMATSSPSENMGGIGQWNFRVRACNDTGCSHYRTGNIVNIEHPILGVPNPTEETLTQLQPATAAGTLPYTAVANSMGDAEVRIPIHVVPGVNGHQPKLTLSYNSNRMRRLVNEGWEEDEVGTGWRIGGFSSIRACGKSTLTSVDPIELGNPYYKPMCMDGKLFVQNNPSPIDESGSVERGQLITSWSAEDHEYVLWDDSGIKIRSTGQVAPGMGGEYTVYYPDGSVSEYGYTEDSRLHLHYVTWREEINGKEYRYRSDLTGHSHLPGEHRLEQPVNSFIYRINKHTDAFGNEIHYEYYKDESRDFVMPKRITYGPKGAHDTRIEFSYQQRKNSEDTNTNTGRYGGYNVPPVNDDGSPMNPADYIDWIINGYTSNIPTAINKITIKHNNAPVREYNLVHEQLTGLTRLARLKHVQMCAYKSAASECLTPLTIHWDSDLNSTQLTRVNEINDNQSSWTQFDYKRVDVAETGVFFTQSPFGPAPKEDFASGLHTPKARFDWQYDNGEWEPSALVEMRTSNGIGGHRTLKYRYLGEGFDSKKGWGFMGYPAVRIEDVDRGIFTYRQYTMNPRHMGRSVAEQVMLGEYGSGNNTMLAKNITIWDSKFLYHSQYRWVSSSASLIMSSPAHSYYNYPRQSISFQYEEGQQIGVLIKENAPQFTPWEKDTDSRFQYPFTRETTTSQWAESVNLSADGTDISHWGIYTLSGITGVQRSQQIDVDYEENRRFDALQVTFPRETRIRIYSGDITGTPEQTTTKIRTAYLINGKAHSLVGSETQFVGDPNLELTTTHHYNQDGIQNSVTVSGINIASRTTSSSHLAANRYPQTLTNALKQSLNQTFDSALGLAITQTDLNGHSTHTEYDAFGRAIAITTPMPYQMTVNTQYDLCDTLLTCPTVNGIYAHSRVWVNSPVSPDTYQYHDGLGRAIRLETIGYNGNTVYLDTHYDRFGQIKRKSLPYFEYDSPLYLEYDYDIRGRLIQTTHPDGSHKTVHYGIEQGQKVITRTAYVKDASGTPVGSKINKSYFNAINEIEKTTDAYGTAEAISTEFTYNATGLTHSITVGGAEVASFEYDNAGNRLILNDQNVGTVTSQYTALGQLTSTLDTLHQETTTTYDILGRPLTQTTDDGIQTWRYDPTANIGGLDYTEFKDNRNGYSHTNTLSYEPSGKPSSTTTEIHVPGYAPRPYQQHFTYDPFGRSDTLTYASGVTVQSRYTPEGYLEAVTDNQGNSLQSIITVDELGNVSEMTYGSGITQTKTYNPLNGRLESTFTASASATLQNNQFNWRSDGLLESRSSHTGQAKSEHFTYDHLSRLRTAATASSGHTRTTATSYALNGNILSKTANNSLGNEETNVTGYQYGTTANAGPNAVSQANINGVATTLYYNPNGNITHYDTATGTDKFVDWTARGKPWRITQGTSANDTTPDARDEIAYGINGARYYKHSTWQDSNGKEQTDITFYVGEYEDVLPGNDPKYNRVERTRINDHVLHIRITTHLGTEDENIEFFHKDHLGSIEAITDIKGNLLQQMSFDAFGARRKTNWAGELTEAETEALLSEVGIGTSRGYTGHEHLDRTGLIHMNGRVYDPTLGRFLSADPIVQAPYFSQSYNRYTYVWNNPLGMNDPSGYEGNDSLGEDDKEAPEPEPEKKREKPKPGVHRLHAGNGYSIVYGDGSSDDEESEGARSDQEESEEPEEGELTTELIRGDSNNGEILEEGVLGQEGYPLADGSLGQVGIAEWVIPAAKAPKVLGFLGKLLGLGSKKTAGMLCFVEGTLVHTQDGLKPIEEIQVGDLVASKDEFTGETTWKPVTELFRNYDKSILKVTLVTAEGEEELLGVTAEHPFWVDGQGWVDAGELHEGQIISSVDGDVLTVNSIVPDEQLHDTYNFEVADYHTYFVGEQGAWVHNQCGGLTSSIKQSPRLVKEAQIAGKSHQAGIDKLTAQLSSGNLNPGIGSKSLGSGISYARGRDGARVFFRQTGNGVDILGKSSKANESVVIKEVLKTFGN